VSSARVVDDRKLAIVDVLFSLAIIGGFGTALWVHTMSPGALYGVALPAFVFGVVWLVLAIGRLRR
jgi:divalent metal cation (Fe/Co/Zn/Cd) transporter